MRGNDARKGFDWSLEHKNSNDAKRRLCYQINNQSRPLRTQVCIYRPLPTLETYVSMLALRGTQVPAPGIVAARPPKPVAEMLGASEGYRRCPPPPPPLCMSKHPLDAKNHSQNLFTSTRGAPSRSRHGPTSRSRPGPTASTFWAIFPMVP